MQNIIKLKDVSLADVNRVGGKNASLGEMIQNLSKGAGIKCPGGIATTVEAYKAFLEQNNLVDIIHQIIATINFEKVGHLDKASKRIRKLIISTPFPTAFENELVAYCDSLNKGSVAVRSSATTEDLATASFAGAQDTFLNIKGTANILRAIKKVYASLFTSRAISYRHHNGFDHTECAISVGIQQMVRADKACSGVVFTLDPESGFDKVLVISASYGLGEAIVQGLVDTDEFIVLKHAVAAKKSAILQRKLGDKSVKSVYTNDIKNNTTIKVTSVPKKYRGMFCLNDEEIVTLSRYALAIEKHYGKPMDIEWAKDGVDGQLYILQARAITVNNHVGENNIIETYSLSKPSRVLVQGQSIGQRIGHGVAKVILDIKQKHLVKPGDVLVTNMTDPDWEPIMKMASAIVTNGGGRTCHAAIIARELGLPAVVGCKNATSLIHNNTSVTVSCAEGQIGKVYEGKIDFYVKKIAIDKMPELPVNICINMGNPDMAFATQFLPNEGVGLARLEFIIANMIGIHPNAALNIEDLSVALKRQILEKTQAYKNPVEYYVEKLKEGMSIISAAFFPKQVIFRFSDFKSNEYANLLGGAVYEPTEENPMIGFRGASRYNDAGFAKCFELECRAIKRLREEMGLVNAQVMIPFVRTVKELTDIIDLMKKFGLQRGEHDLKIYMMCEIPSNVILAKQFLEHVDGFSIGSNDLTQLTLGLDRDSNRVASLFDERNDAVKILLHQAITECKKQNKYIGICGQGPSDYPDFAQWLMDEGIEAMSLNADTVVSTWMMLGQSLKK